MDRLSNDFYGSENTSRENYSEEKVRCLCGSNVMMHDLSMNNIGRTRKKRFAFDPVMNILLQSINYPVKPKIIVAFDLCLDLSIKIPLKFEVLEL